MSVSAVWVAPGLALLGAAIVALALAPRGGRLRALPGWVGFWAVLTAVLAVLTRVPHTAAVTVIGILMFLALREYFFLVPLRAQDRFAILAAYLSIPVALLPELSERLAPLRYVIPAGLIAGFPVLLAVRSRGAGWFESLGRVLAAIVVFLVAASHLSQVVSTLAPGRVALFAMLALAGELPQRITGRFRPGEGVLRPLAGLLAGAAAAALVGVFAGPLYGVPLRGAAIVGVLVALGTAAGALVAGAVAQDLDLQGPAARHGRGAVLDRAFPAAYAAPLFVHSLWMTAGLS
jgi:phosphatidate cytidylyltransferase